MTFTQIPIYPFKEMGGVDKLHIHSRSALKALLALLVALARLAQWGPLCHMGQGRQSGVTGKPPTPAKHST